MRYIASVSGGKDSVAMWLWARRNALDPVPVYQDTKWEWDKHYQHLDMLERLISPLTRIAGPKSFCDLVLQKGGFPSRVRKWCTEELKLKPFRTWLDKFRDSTGDDVTVMVGVRREESASRAELPEREWSDFYDCALWRPILDWTVNDVILEHKRAGVPMHPLYHLGANRVGCFPCVGAGKVELALVAEIAPEKIAQIRELETVTGQTMFTRDRRVEKRRQGDSGPSVVPIGIDEVVTWARTKRGGKEIQLLRPREGCARWGTCEAYPVEEKRDG